MLASLLPGLRDLRTPLAVGYLWLVTLWLLFHEWVPLTAESAPEGPVQSMYQLGTLSGATVVLAAISLVAYLLGVVVSVVRLPWNVMPALLARESVGVALVVERRLLVRAQNRLLRLLLRRRSSQGLIEVLRRPVADRYSAAYPQVLDPDDAAPQFSWRTSSSVYDVMFVVAGELPDVAIRLQAKNRDLWDSFDRAKAESEFRSSIAFALAPLSVVLMVNWTIYAGLLLIFGSVLLMMGAAKAVEATSTLVQAIRLDQARPPIFDRLEEIAKGHQQS